MLYKYWPINSAGGTTAVLALAFCEILLMKIRTLQVELGSWWCKMKMTQTFPAIQKSRASNMTIVLVFSFAPSLSPFSLFFFVFVFFVSLHSVLASSQSGWTMSKIQKLRKLWQLSGHLANKCWIHIPFDTASKYDYQNTWRHNASDRPSVERWLVSAMTDKKSVLTNRSISLTQDFFECM